MELSILRILGLMLCAGLLWTVFVRLRIPKGQRPPVALPTFAAVLLLIVSLFPSVVNTPSEFLSLASIPGGRILTLLVLSTAALFLSTLYLYTKLAHSHLQMDALFRHTVIRDFFDAHANERIEDGVLVLIPALNEAENLKALLPRIPKAVCGRSVATLVIDDGSHDDTGEVARRLGVWVARHPINRGGGAALRTGFDIARQNGAYIIVTMDADGQHDPANIEPLVAFIIEQGADIVIGSRVLGAHERDSMMRAIGIGVFSRFINGLMGESITDCSSGFRAIRVGVLERMQLMQDQYHTAELIIEAAKQGLHIGEVPIVIKRRQSGVSKKGRDVVYGLNFFAAIMRTWWR